MKNKVRTKTRNYEKITEEKLKEIRRKIERLAEEYNYGISVNPYWSFEECFKKDIVIVSYRLYKNKKYLRLKLVYHYYHPTNFMKNEYFVEKNFYFYREGSYVFSS